MRLTVNVTLERSIDCKACNEELPGPCYCDVTRDVSYEVVGDVTLVREHRHVVIVSVRETSPNPREVPVGLLDRDEREAFEAKLWSGYVEKTSPRFAAQMELTRVLQLLETSTNLGLEMGTDPKTVLATLRQVRHLALGLKGKREAA